MMMKATVYAAAVAGLFALAAPGAAQAAMPVNAGVSLAGSGLVQTVGWYHGRYYRRHRWHRRHRVCWVTRRVHWRHGRRVVTRVRRCAWR
jgi:hypothetical protein